MTSGSNMTGATGNTTGGSSIPTTKPAGLPDASSLLLHPGPSGPMPELAYPSGQPHKVLPPNPSPIK
jgi:hypothetical protein